MSFKTLLAVICSLLISSSVVAQTPPAVDPPTQSSSQFTLVIQNQVNMLRLWWTRFFSPRPVTPQPAPVVHTVPELDGNMAFLALGLTVAVGALVREKRRKD